jgi:hypothetical protein
VASTSVCSAKEKLTDKSDSYPCHCVVLIPMSAVVNFISRGYLAHFRCRVSPFALYLKGCSGLQASTANYFHQVLLSGSHEFMDLDESMTAVQWSYLCSSLI